MARRDIPDARERLDYVMAKTEEATHQTLGAIETTSDALEALLGTARDAREASPDADLSARFDRIEHLGKEAREALTNALVAQSFQDVTGQVLRKVIALVHNLEQTMGQIVGTDDAEANGANGDGRGHGPAALSSERADAASDQTEVDDLLDRLGV
jgi:chemotaxis protein CheZ